MKASNVNLAMKARGLKYFSSLTPQQKDKSILQIKKLKSSLQNLPDGLAIQMMGYSALFENIDLTGCKMFKKDGVYYPLNIMEFLNPKSV